MKIYAMSGDKVTIEKEEVTIPYKDGQLLPRQEQLLKENNVHYFLVPECRCSCHDISRFLFGRYM